MSETKPYIQSLFVEKKIVLDFKRDNLLEEFAADEDNINAVNQILANQKMLVDKWKLINRKKDIDEQKVSIPNATVGKTYEALINFEKLNWNDIVFSDFEGLESTGLEYDNENEIISGIPTQSGDLKIRFKFRLEGEPDDSVLNEKTISLIINADPKTLWKNIESDKADPYWKEDDVTQFDKLGDKHIVVSSKRGRSHANTGGFREDDFACKYFENTGWSAVAVSDGAGSAKLSRAGSKIACQTIIEYFTENLTEESFSVFDVLVQEHNEKTGDDTLKKLSHFVYNTLGKAALTVHKKLEETANKLEVPLKDLHATLIFVLIKKYDFGYAILSFGVGDCPIGLLNKDMSAITLMNWLDVGEFGGGTRFITMPEIFQSDKLSTRFGFQLVDDFSYLMLMTDGIYDPKFIVEANLEKIENWKAFLEDLDGKNDENIRVELKAENTELTTQLSAWMDFWSSGNHDDRTLAIIF